MCFASLVQRIKTVMSVHELQNKFQRLPFLTNRYLKPLCIRRCSSTRDRALSNKDLVPIPWSIHSSLVHPLDESWSNKEHQSPVQHQQNYKPFLPICVYTSRTEAKQGGLNIQDYQMHHGRKNWGVQLLFLRWDFVKQGSLGQGLFGRKRRTRNTIAYVAHWCCDLVQLSSVAKLTRE